MRHVEIQLSFLGITLHVLSLILCKCILVHLNHMTIIWLAAWLVEVSESEMTLPLSKRAFVV